MALLEPPRILPEQLILLVLVTIFLVFYRTSVEADGTLPQSDVATTDFGFTFDG
ncbi:hypothetical protein [Halorubrum amylolyticum]|uniref:hypothetical protein n=1 Tax=Halorubrum amylolyticum TaxID=2508724 RepID=UPI0013E8E965|nr:hypothetical protein [Halorubrum amylolyticum]